MGEAKRRGTAEQRREESIVRRIYDAQAQARMKACNQRMHALLVAEANARKEAFALANNQKYVPPAARHRQNSSMTSAMLLGALSIALQPPPPKDPR